jgi:D-serine deaminase-like pyridoxal phosphate-dependent protein
MPRCGCTPDEAGRLADHARGRGLTVRGVMGYEGHVVGVADRPTRVEQTEASMQMLLAAHADVGGDIVSGGGTGTYDINSWVTEIQAGSYALMDTAYAHLDLPFRPALSVIATVISVSEGWAVADCGLKSLGMDHGDPTVTGHTVWFCSDEHVVIGREQPVAVGDRVRVWPAHVDPTVAYHERMHLARDDEVVETWDVDLRGW